MGLLRSKRAGHTCELSLSENFYEYFHLEKKAENSEVKQEN
jgi:chromosome segregation and condensation protein ScpB